MDMQRTYTTVYFDYGIYSKNKIKLKKIISTHTLRWNASKVKLGMSYNELLEAYKFFKVEDKIVNDKNLVGRDASSGVWENGENAIKIIMMEKKSEDEHLPVLLIFKGDESIPFYKEFIAACVNLGCWIGKVQEFEGKFESIFSKRRNVELIDRLNSIEGGKEALKKEFLIRVGELENVGYKKFSDEFVSGWLECIDKYGDYKFDDFRKEMERKNAEIEKKKEKEDEIIKNEVKEKIKNVEEKKVENVEKKVENVNTGDVKKKRRFKVRMSNV